MSNNEGSKSRRGQQPKLDIPPELTPEVRARVQRVIDDPDGVVDLNDIYLGPSEIPRDHAQAVRVLQQASPNHVWQYIRPVLMMMYLARMPHAVIAKKFNVSVYAVERWLTRARKEQKLSSLSFDVSDAIQGNLDHRDHLIAYAQQQLFVSQTANEKNMWVRTLTTLLNDKVTTLNMAGAFVDAPLSKQGLEAANAESNESGQSDIDILKGLMTDFLSGEVLDQDCTEISSDIPDTEEPADNPAPISASSSGPARATLSSISSSPDQAQAHEPDIGTDNTDTTKCGKRVKSGLGIRSRPAPRRR